MAGGGDSLPSRQSDQPRPLSLCSIKRATTGSIFRLRTWRKGLIIGRPASAITRSTPAPDGASKRRRRGANLSSSLLMIPTFRMVSRGPLSDSYLKNIGLLEADLESLRNSNALKQPQERDCATTDLDLRRIDIHKQQNTIFPQSRNSPDCGHEQPLFAYSVELTNSPTILSVCTEERRRDLGSALWACLMHSRTQETDICRR